MNKFHLKGNVTGLFFVLGAGFTASTQASASALTEENVKALNACAALSGGESGTTVAIPVEDRFAVCFVRAKDLDGNGNVKANALNPSKRRFKTELDANVHGNRFKTIENHKGFYVIKTSTPGVDSWINPATGKTNPLIGKGRTNR